MPVNPVVLDVDHVTFRRAGTQVLHDVTMRVHAGEHWALLGPNGAGKSTLLFLCGATVFPTTGTVSVFDKRLGTVELQALRRLIGHIDPRHVVRLPLTATQVVLTGLTGTREPPLRWEATSEQTELAREQLCVAGLEKRRDALWATLSQGERGRVLIARALIARPRLLLFDEPATGLDLAARENLLETVDTLHQRDTELASILVTHHLEELPVTTTHALVLSEGRVVSRGEIGHAVTSDTISRAFGLPVDVTCTDGRWGARTRRR